MAEQAKSAGNAAFSDGDFAAAVCHFSHAIALSPTDHILYSNRSAAYASLELFDEAITDANRTIELKPKWFKGYSRLGAAYVGLGRRNDAIAAYMKGLEFDPDCESLKAGLADARISKPRATTCKGETKQHHPNSSNCKENSLVVVPEAVPIAFLPPIVSSFKECIRPLLDCIDKLRHLKITNEGIQLPTIVVVGDQSSGKSSVLESLAGISLPRGQGICTRVPLIMRLQHHQSPEPEVYLEFKGKTVHTDEANLTQAISLATDEIAGTGKGISNTVLTLVVKKNGVPDLTMVDLPGIIWVPTRDQPKNICEQISEIIMEYIRPAESIILNVISATVDFSTCSSIRMSQSVDKSGERTLAVVTKSDMCPEGLLEKVSADDVNIGLGYVCVRNRIGDESYEMARVEESRLFESHPLLSKIDKSMVGFPVLARKLVEIQATIVAKCLPGIVKKINEKLNWNISELSKMPKNLSSVSEAITAFGRIIGSAKESLRKILQTGEFEEYPDDNDMHCMPRLAEMLDKYSDELKKVGAEMLDKYSDELKKVGANDLKVNCLIEEIQVLEEDKRIGLPNFLSRSAFLTILQKKVNAISSMPELFVGQVWNYIECVVIKVLMKHSENHPQIQSTMLRAAQNLITKIKEHSMNRVKEIVEMEKLTDYTCCPEFISESNKLIGQKQLFDRYIGSYCTMQLDGFGEINIEGLDKYPREFVMQAFELKMRVTAYWNIVLRRLVDYMALHLLYSIQNMLIEEIYEEILNELMDPRAGGIERMLDELPFVAAKRERLNRSIKLLKESKEVVAGVMDKVASYGY